MTCSHCARETPDLPFCTFCGADLGGSTDRHGRRLGRFAAHPHEHVLRPAVASTLLPHAGHSQLRDFRVAGLTGVAVIVGLTVAGFVGAALVACAILVPALFLLYLYETEVYRHEPLAVLARSLVWGAVVGVALTLAANNLVHPDQDGVITNLGEVLLAGLAIPVAAEIFKPALLLPLQRRFGESVDGLTFGVAAGLGYALAETAVNFHGEILDAATRLPLQSWLLTMVSAGVLVPLMQGACAGAVATAVWRLRRRRGGELAVVILAAAILAHVAFTLGSTMLLVFDAPAWVVPIWQAMIVVGLLVGVRVLLHDALLEEAHDMGLADRRCSHCERLVEAAGFCPTCGLALVATPRARAVRS